MSVDWPTWRGPSGCQQERAAGRNLVWPTVLRRQRHGLHHLYERRAAWTVCGDRTCTAFAAPDVVAVRYCVARRLTRW